jgi:ferredoxin-NADP reductase/MOSC domain-containing protein YiiM
MTATDPAVAGRLLAVNVGLPRDIGWHGRTVHTGIWKQPVEGRRMVRKLNVDGDGQGDLAGHGGEHRAVFVYQIESYRYWAEHLGRDDLVHGQFGENFTVEGLPDDQVCIGDRYRIGDAELEVTQPRVTCYRVGIRMDEPRMPALLVSHHRPGFYLRVLQEGEVGAGDEIVKLAPGPEAMSVAEIDGLLYLPAHPRRDLARALRVPALSEGWRASFRALLEQDPALGNQGLSSVAGGRPAWRGFRPFRVSTVDRESATVVSIHLVPADDERVAGAAPGQFVTIRVRPGADAAPLLRSYSLSGPPGGADLRISVKREHDGVVSRYLHTVLEQGDTVEVAAPRGSFVLGPGDGPVVLASAGVGATPVLAMLHALAAQRSRRPVWWVHSARSRGEHPFATEVDDLLARLPDGHRVVCYSSPGPADRQGPDFDRRGRVSGAVLDEEGVPIDGTFYVCGPAPFMHDLSAALVARGVTPDRILTEIFGSNGSVTPGVVDARSEPPHPPVGPVGSGPDVSFTRSNLTVRWDPGFGTLLELAEACAVPVRWSCRSGVCHTCETGLVSGAVLYRPDPIEEPGVGNAYLCCSSPQTDVVLDL